MIYFIILLFIPTRMNNYIQCSQFYEFYRDRRNVTGTQFYQRFAHVIKMVTPNLFSSTQVLQVTENETVYDYGEDPEEFYFVLEGIVRLYISHNKKVKKQHRKLLEKSIELSNTFIGEHEIFVNRRRLQALQTVNNVVLLKIPKDFIGSIKFPKIQKNLVFEELHAISYQLIPKIFETNIFRRGSRFNTDLYPIGILLSGQYVVDRNITIIKQSEDDEYYEIKKDFNILSVGQQELLLNGALCKSSETEVWTISKERFDEYKLIDPKIEQNLAACINNLELIVQQRVNRIVQTYNYTSTEKSLGFPIKQKTEPSVLNEQYEIKRLKDFVHTEKNLPARIGSLKNNNNIKKLKFIQEESPYKMILPALFNNVLIKVPLKKSNESTVKKRIQQIQSNSLTKVQYEKVNEEFNKLFTPMAGLKKFELKMFYRENKGKIKTGGFSFFKSKEIRCKQRRSLVISEDSTSP